MFFQEELMDIHDSWYSIQALKQKKVGSSRFIIGITQAEFRGCHLWKQPAHAGTIHILVLLLGSLSDKGDT